MFRTRRNDYRPKAAGAPATELNVRHANR